MTIKLSDIPQRDAFEILAAATKTCGVCHFRDQLAFTTQQLCNLLKVKPQDIDETVATYPAEILVGEVFMAIGDELQELLRALGMSDRPIASARLWTPRAVLRIAALMRNPVARAIHVQIAAYVASIEDQDWMAESRLLEESIESEKYLHPPSLSSINELPPLQPEVGTPPPTKIGRFSPKLEPFREKLEPFSGFQLLWDGKMRITALVIHLTTKLAILNKEKLEPFLREVGTFLGCNFCSTLRRFNAFKLQLELDPI